MAKDKLDFVRRNAAGLVFDCANNAIVQLDNSSQKFWENEICHVCPRLYWPNQTTFRECERILPSGIFHQNLFVSVFTVTAVLGSAGLVSSILILIMFIKFRKKRLIKATKFPTERLHTDLRLDAVRSNAHLSAGRVITSVLHATHHVISDKLFSLCRSAESNFESVSYFPRQRQSAQTAFCHQLFGFYLGSVGGTGTGKNILFWLRLRCM